MGKGVGDAAVGQRLAKSPDFFLRDLFGSPLVAVLGE
jgi:hypothetical protein